MRAREEPSESEARPPRAFGSLCEDCAHVRAVRSAKGATFLMCRRAAEDPRYPRYPPQPVISCAGFERFVPSV